VGQLDQLKACQERFRTAAAAEDAEAMVVENNAFHAIIGAMAHSAFLQPSLNKLLIEHARIGHTFFRPRNDEMRSNLVTASEHHDRFIAAIGERDEAAVVGLVREHWELSRWDMEMFIAPKGLESESMPRLSSDPPLVRRPRAAKAASRA
jgi:DNA-binding GntR family transcriptional regulator